MGIIQKFTNALAGSRAVDVINTVRDKISGIRSGIQGWVGSIRDAVANGGAFVGLNYQHVPQIREAIRAYVKDVQAAADEFNDSAEAERAVKGEVVAATKSYVKAIKEVLDAYITGLLVYSDKMQEYYEAYAKSDTTLSEDVSSEAQALTSKAADVTYTESK